MLVLLLQVHFSVIDLDLHSRFTPGSGESVFDRDATVAQKTQVGSGHGLPYSTPFFASLALAAAVGCVSSYIFDPEPFDGYLELSLL